MKISTFQIVIVFSINLLLLQSISASDLEIKSEPLDEKTINYYFRNVSVETLLKQELTIPPNLFLVWKALQENVPLEVGGGLDFNQDKVLERIKLSLGEENNISFIPDFEVAWHTHPGVYSRGELKNISLPSPADIQISILGFYNYWLMISGEIKEDKSNLLRLRSYSEDIERPLAVELSIVVDREGIYFYKPKREFWEPIWQRSLNETILAVRELSSRLQSVINWYYPQVEQGIITPDRARTPMLEQYRDIANIDIEYVPWDTLLDKGLKIQLDVVETLKHPRKSSKKH